MTDLNSVSANIVQPSSSNNKSIISTSALLKKIIMPLISPVSQINEHSSLESTDTTTATTTLFDSDHKFQRFVIFLVDFIYIIYDKISDTPLTGSDLKSYDQNDEISIFAFAILIHSLSMGLESSARRTRMSGLFKNNLNLIKSQFR